MPTIEVIALRSFPWSEDGYTEKFAAEKSVFRLPERLFHGLNKAGYVRRASIGDGHIALNPDREQIAALSAADAPPDDQIPIQAEADAPAAAIDGAAAAPAAEAGTTQTKVAAPSPASATAPLSEDETAALKDGSWKDWRFFKQRSVAAKLSTEPMRTTEDVVPVLEAMATELAGE